MTIVDKFASMLLKTFSSEFKGREFNITKVQIMAMPSLDHFEAVDEDDMLYVLSGWVAVQGQYKYNGHPKYFLWKAIHASELLNTELDEIEDKTQKITKKFLGRFLKEVDAYESL